MVHRYRNHAYSPIGEWVGAAWLTALFIALPAVGLARALYGGDLVGAAVLLSVVWLWPVCNSLFRRCHEVRLGDDGNREFQGLLRSRRLRVHEIESMRLPRWSDAYEDLRSSGTGAVSSSSFSRSTGSSNSWKS